MRLHSRYSRILLATAESAMQAGYADSSVTGIAARAGLHKPYFYDYFHDKRQAFLALHELAFQQSMSVGAGAYFTAKPWPERVWHSLLATSQLHAAYPAIAHVAFVETDALGPSAIQRREDSCRAFTTLLRADRRQTGLLQGNTVAEATGAAIFEIAHERVAKEQTDDLPSFTYLATYLALAPFLGVQEANRFVERKLTAAEHRPPRSNRHK